MSVRGQGVYPRRMDPGGGVMDTMVAFFTGMVAGAVVGIFTLAVIVAAGNADDRLRQFNERSQDNEDN